MKSSIKQTLMLALLLSLLLPILLGACADGEDDTEDDPLLPEAAQATATPEITTTAVSSVLAEPLATISNLGPTRAPLHLPAITPASASEIAAFDPFNFELDRRRELEAPQSFFMNYRYVFTSTENTVQHLDILLRFSSEPDLITSVIDFGLTNAFQDSSEVSNVSKFGPDSYLYTEGVGCIRVPDTNLLLGIEDFFVDFPDQYILNGLLPQLVDSDVMINGAVSDRYLAVANDVSQGDLSVEKLTVELFVDQETGHVIRLSLLAENSVGTEGNSSFLENPFVLGGGDIRIEIDITGLNKPQDVALPPICEAAGPTLFPVVEDAAVSDSSLGLTYYNTMLSGEEIIAFYRREMPLLGWEDTDPDKAFDFSQTSQTIIFENEAGQRTTFNIRFTQGVEGLVVIRSGDY